MMEPINNTHTQLLLAREAGLCDIAIVPRFTPWHIGRYRDGWKIYSPGWTDIIFPRFPHGSDKAALKAAMEWAEQKHGIQPHKWRGNAMRDKVHADVYKRFPLRMPKPKEPTK